MNDIRKVIGFSMEGGTREYIALDSIMPIGRFEVVDGEWRVVYDYGELADNAARTLSDIPMSGEDARLLNGLGWWKVDRPGLLALAEELDRWSMGPLPSTGIVGMWADSIRELCGEVAEFATASEKNTTAQEKKSPLSEKSDREAEKRDRKHRGEEA